jgi:class 3 adenylate cyclase
MAVGKSVGQRLVRLFRPDVPEPIAEATFRLAAKAVIVIMGAAFAANVVKWLLASLQPELEPRAFGRFIAVSGVVVGAMIGLNVWMLVGAHGTRAWRASAAATLLLGHASTMCGAWVAGSVTGWTFVLVMLTIVFYRVLYDARLGLFAWMAGGAMHLGLVLLEGLGVLPSHAGYPGRVSPEYASLRTQLAAFSTLFGAYAMAWLVASYLALRIRTGEHNERLLNAELSRSHEALRELNAELEARVARQVDLLERSSRLRRYLAPQLVERIMTDAEDPVALRERRPVTVMFADMRGFTHLVERVSPEVLSAVLNLYFDEVSRIAFSHGGTIDKFIGDAVMVFFGWPAATGEADQALRCVRMGLEIQQRIAALAAEFVACGAPEPVAVRVGIASGQAIAGGFGARHRVDFTIVGPPVNRAARLEPFAPAGGVLIDEQTAQLLGPAAQCAPAGELALKGFAQPVRTFTVQALAAAGQAGQRKLDSTRWFR